MFLKKNIDMLNHGLDNQSLKMTDFADNIREIIDRDIFELDELKAVFCPQMSYVALQNRVARSSKLLRLKKGLYAFSEVVILDKKSKSRLKLMSILL